MGRYTLKTISKLAGCHPQTVRRLADLVLISCERDFNQWRIFNNPNQTALLVRQLLGVEALDVAGSKRIRLARRRNYLEDLHLQREELIHHKRRGGPESDRGAAKGIMAGLNESLLKIDLEIREVDLEIKQLETECCKRFEKTGTEKDD